MKHARIHALTALVALMTIGGVAKADDFATNHPRRAQVNQREAHQQMRILNGAASGKLTADQQAALQQREAQIKAEEIADVRANGGYLTNQQQQHINQELNDENREIAAEKNP